MNWDFNANNVNDSEDVIDELRTRLAEDLFSTIRVLSNIVSLTEKFFDGSHSRWVAGKAVELAVALGMPEEDVMEIRIAALLHDLGKIGTSDTSMFKSPAEMNSVEFKKYCMHPELGKALLKEHPGFNQIGIIIQQHHERLDGSGFPDHLAGDSITPAAKIIGIVDVFHNALYKRTRSRENIPTTQKITSTVGYLDGEREKYTSVMNYLYKKRGILFEKKAVDAFIDIVELERMEVGKRSVLRLPVNKIEPGLIFAEDYYSSNGMLIAARGERTTNMMLKALVRLAENGEIPHKILVIK
ncbi:MAG: HD-GYP domain-containing protein [Chloroflexota bacterium]